MCGQRSRPTDSASGSPLCRLSDARETRVISIMDLGTRTTLTLEPVPVSDGDFQSDAPSDDVTRMRIAANVRAILEKSIE